MPRGHYIKFASLPAVNAQAQLTKRPETPDVVTKAKPAYRHKQPISGAVDDRGALEIQRILANSPELKSMLVNEALNASGHPIVSFLQGTPLGQYIPGSNGQNGIPIIRDIINAEVLRRTGLGVYRQRWDKLNPAKQPGVHAGGPSIGQYMQDMEDARLAPQRDLGRIRGVFDRNREFRRKFLMGIAENSGSEDAKNYVKWRNRTKYVPKWFGWRRKAEDKIDNIALDTVGIKTMRPRLVSSGANPNAVA